MKFIEKRKNSYKINFITIISLFIILINICFASTSKNIKNIEQYEKDPALIFSAEKAEAAPNEFPATAGTLKKDDSGFTVEWEDGNLDDFLRQLKDKLGDTFDLESIDFFGSKGEQSKNKDKDSYDSGSVAAHSYHWNNKDIPKHLLERPEQQSRNNLSAKNTKKDKEAKKIEESEDDVAQKDPDDWRYNREWWQRGAGPLTQ